MSEFIVSKRMKDVVEFDKTNKKLRFLLDEGDQVYYYKDLETIGISCEYHHNLKKALAHNLVFPTYAEGRQFVRVGIRMKVRMGQSVFYMYLRTSWIKVPCSIMRTCVQLGKL